MMDAKDKGLYNRYQDEIPDYETFKSMKDKKMKSLLFTGWQAKFGSKAIRKAMKITYATYDYNNRTYGSSATGTEENEEKSSRSRKQSDVIDVTGYAKPNKIVVEAEFEEMPKSLSKLQQEPQEQGKTPFISVEWTSTPEGIRSQLEALATILKFENGEITVKLEVYKQ